MEKITAKIYSETSPNEAQKNRFLKFLTDKYGCPVSLEWVKSSLYQDGFRLEAGGDVYDWSISGRFKQLKDTLSNLPSSNENIISLIRTAVENWTPDVFAEEFGEVLSVGDGIAAVSGLEHAAYGEIVLFSCGIKGMIQDLRPDNCGIIVFGNCREIIAGSKVRRTGKTAGIPVGRNFLGRIVDALGNPIDGCGDIKADDYRPIEQAAPGIVDRQPVNKPIETGLLVIDAMFPIGRGQRELIIGDRQTGKTAIALDTIINQKGKDVICIYVAIGQKASSVAQFAETLKKHSALDYTVILAANAGEATPMQYIAPYSGCALAEYFMYRGKDVLIVYDDLSKHAVAYRTLSLLLERSPGREAYPGDVFYLHSRLLERSAHLSESLGGGSLTALPIVETQAGDVSAYIPTNIISITDGQIFLESELFFEGQRPAVNIGLSVSRVGGAAQTKAVKSASGTIRLDLAQYREMEVFTQFASDLDSTAKNQLVYGQGLVRLLRQPQFAPYSQTEEVLLLVCALNHLMQNIPINRIGEFSRGMLDYIINNYPAICKEISTGKELTQELKQSILSAANEFRASFEQTL